MTDFFEYWYNSYHSMLINLYIYIGIPILLKTRRASEQDFIKVGLYHPVKNYPDRLENNYLDIFRYEHISIKR